MALRMTFKTSALNFDGYRRTPTISGPPPARGSTLETGIARFKAKLVGYLKELDL